MLAEWTSHTPGFPRPALRGTVMPQRVRHERFLVELPPLGLCTKSRGGWRIGGFSERATDHGESCVWERAVVRGL